VTTTTQTTAPAPSSLSDAEIGEFLRGMWSRRKDRYSEKRAARTAGLPKVEMSYIGG